MLYVAPVVEANQAAFMTQWVALLHLAHQRLIDTGYLPDDMPIQYIQIAQPKEFDFSIARNGFVEQMKQAI